MLTRDEPYRARPGEFIKRAGVAAGITLLIFVSIGAALVMTGAIANGRGGSGAGKVEPQSLPVQANLLVEQQRAAVAAYAVKLAEFKRATARPVGAAGINLDAAETRRRDDVLTGLVLDCINAVDRYNLAAQPIPPARLRSAGLPERFVWAVDCWPGQ